MKKVTLIFLLVLIKSHVVFTQVTLNNNEITNYEISVTSRPQTIQLIEYDNGKYYGNIKTELSKGRWNTTWLSRFWRNLWNIKSQDIVDNSQISEKIVKKLITELKNNGIETIKNCNTDEKCKNYNFLDGDYAIFRIKTKTINRNYGFEELYPLTEVDLEKIELRIQAQKLITIIYDNINLKKEFSNTFKRLPRGHYNYSCGAGVCIIKNRKRKKFRK